MKRRGQRQIFKGELRGYLQSNPKTSVYKLLLKWHFSNVLGFDVDRKGTGGMWPSNKLRNLLCTAHHNLALCKKGM